MQIEASKLLPYQGTRYLYKECLRKRPIVIFICIGKYIFIISLESQVLEKEIFRGVSFARDGILVQFNLIQFNPVQFSSVLHYQHANFNSVCPIMQRSQNKHCTNYIQNKQINKQTHTHTHKRARKIQHKNFQRNLDI